MNFYSQQGEDIYTYRNFINKYTPDGIFVELGAMNGITYSNTKFFEDTLGMSGTLIEPTKQYNELIMNRPKCKNYNKAVYCRETKVSFLGDNATAGLVEEMSETFKTSWHNNNNNEYYWVDGEPFMNILKSSNISYIDFLSIDVEGGEEIVLKTMDFTIPVYLICIELDGHDLEKNERCRQILINNGFSFDKRICINEFWVNHNYYRKDILYDNKIITKSFGNIYELGNFYFLEKHCADEVQNNLRT